MMRSGVQKRTPLLGSLHSRFEKNMHRHEGMRWETVLARLDAKPSALESLRQMEASGGEPDVIGRPDASGQLTYCDCSPESPAGRRSLCYDRDALNERFRGLLKTSDAPSELNQFEYRFRHNDGSWLWLESVAVNALANPSVRGIIAHSRDINRR
jgi:PAS domain-containing protein